MEVSFTERELDVITVLWDHGPSTAAECRAHLAEDLAAVLRLSIAPSHATGS